MVSSLVVNRRILASFVNILGIKLAKSESPIGRIFIIQCCKEGHIEEYSLAVPPGNDVIVP